MRREKLVSLRSDFEPPRLSEIPRDSFARQRSARKRRRQLCRTVTRDYRPTAPSIAGTVAVCIQAPAAQDPPRLFQQLTGAGCSCGCRVPSSASAAPTTSIPTSTRLERLPTDRQRCGRSSCGDCAHLATTKERDEHNARCTRVPVDNHNGVAMMRGVYAAGTHSSSSRRRCVARCDAPMQSSNRYVRFPSTTIPLRLRLRRLLLLLLLLSKWHI